jgi:hypothetical protein
MSLAEPTEVVRRIEEAKTETELDSIATRPFR